MHEGRYHTTTGVKFNKKIISLSLFLELFQLLTEEEPPCKMHILMIYKMIDAIVVPRLEN